MSVHTGFATTFFPDLRPAVTARPTGPSLTSAIGGGVSPLVTRERFAEIVGLPTGVIVGMINKGYLPTVSIGKYSLVNLAALQRSCLEKEFSL